MTDIQTVARPYAKAIFELALRHNGLKEWSAALHRLAMIAANKTMQPILSNPLISKDECAKLFIDVAADLSEENKRLVTLLAENQRLEILPAVSKLYEEAVAEHERTIDVKVISAYAIDQKRQQRIVHALQNRLKRQVNIHCVIDKALLGGAIIHAGDQVIDGSLRRKLKKLYERLCS